MNAEKIAKSTTSLVTHIQIEPTTRCNFSCKFCYGRSMKQGDMKFDVFEKIINIFPDTAHIELQGEGEPMLHPQFFDMATFARSRGIKLSYVTNGSQLRAETIDKLLNIPFETVSVSIDSADKRKFKEIRGGDLSKIIQGLELFIHERKKHGLNKPAVGLSVTVLKDTKNELLNIAALYNKLKLDGGIFVQPLQTRTPYVNRYNEDMKNQILSKKEEIELFALTSPKREKSNYREYREIHKNRSAISSYFDDLFRGIDVNQTTCPFLERNLYITFEGYITPCCMIKDIHRYSLGKIGEDSYDTIVARRNHMRQQLSKGSIPDACMGCTMVEKRKGYQ